MKNLKPRSVDPLISLASSKLKSTEPDIWDTDARTLWEAEARATGMWDEAAPKRTEAAWNTAIRQMELMGPVKHRRYLRLRQEIKRNASVDPYSLDWPALCVGGSTDGKEYHLVLNVEDQIVNILLTAKELESPALVLSRLKHSTGKFNITNEFDDPISWQNSVVSEWWQRLERNMDIDEMEIAIETVRRFCRIRIINTTDDPAAFEQTAKAVDDGEYLYVSWEGIMKYSRHEIGGELSAKLLANTMIRLGFKNERKRLEDGKRVRFWSILKEKFYDGVPTRETGDGQEPRDGEPSVIPDEKLDFNIILEEERGRLESQNQTPDSIPF